jgi:hypothetical protein
MSKFFDFKVDGLGTVPVCEMNYHTRTRLVCSACPSLIDGPYIEASGRQYHENHFVCYACLYTFSVHDRYYEIDGNRYCLADYVQAYAFLCLGCQVYIRSHYVEVSQGKGLGRWHPECYLMARFWRYSFACAVPATRQDGMQLTGRKGFGMDIIALEQSWNDLERKIKAVWMTLSAFTQSTATSLVRVTEQVSNGKYLSAMLFSINVICHFELLLNALMEFADSLKDGSHAGMGMSRKAFLADAFCSQIHAKIQTCVPNAAGNLSNSYCGAPTKGREP